MWQVEALMSKAQTRVICASRQIGKSLLLRTICYKEMMENPGIEIIYAAMTIKQVKAIAFHPMFLASIDRLFPDACIKTVNKTDMIVELTNGSRIRFVGTEALDALRGLTADIVILDEFAFMDPEVFTIFQPIISARRGKFVIASTPKGYNHFYDLVNKGIKGHHTFIPTIRTWIVPITDVDLPNSTPEAIAEAKATMSMQAWQQEFLCSFTTAVGQVYSSYDISLNNTLLELDPKLPIHIGMDMNVAKFCAVVGQRIITDTILPNGQRNRTEHMHIVEEIVLTDSNTQAMANEIARRYPQWRGRTIVYPDASGSARKTSAAKDSTDHSILRRAGFTLLHPSKNPEISDRVNAVNGMFCNALDQRRLFVGNQCIELIKSLLGQTYKNGKPEKKNGEADLSGPVDGLGYLVNYLYPIRLVTSITTNAFGYR